MVKYAEGAFDEEYVQTLGSLLTKNNNSLFGYPSKNNISAVIF